jgi:outer membrane biosynthesis protein TonB
MQNPSLPPEIPKQSLAPLWIGLGVLVVIVGVVWALASRSSEPKPKSEPAAAAAPAVAPTPTAAEPSAPAPPAPPPPRLEHAPPPPPPAHAIPADAVVPAGPAPSTAAAQRDPNCDEPCRGKETAELLSSLRAKAGQARSCYERALGNNGALAGKLEVALRVGANGAACSASIANDTLGDAAVKSCALARFRGGKYPKPTGGCVDVSVPMNFMPAGSR